MYLEEIQKKLTILGSIVISIIEGPMWLSYSSPIAIGLS